MLTEALDGVLSDIASAGTSDLAAAGLKFSGNAQQRKRDFLLHHGTLLYAFELGRVARYLRMPPRQPDYRQGRPHEAFLQNLAISGEELKRRLRVRWAVDQEMTAWPAAAVQRLCEEKYRQEEWTYRR